MSALNDSALYRTGKFVRRHTLGVIAAALAVVALLASSANAIRSAAVARQERATAERRFQEGRQFARFVLFQLDDVMQSGITPARKSMVEKALQYLNGLEKDSVDDPSLQHELIEGYLKIGDLQGNLFAANVGDPAAARKSYERALEIADRAANAHTAEPGALRDQAIVSMKLGNLLSQNSRRPEALLRFHAAQATLERLAQSNSQAERDLLEVLRSIGLTQLQMGNAQGALESYQQYLQLAQAMAREPGKVPASEARRSVAYGCERVGYMQARTGALREGLQNLQQALLIYRELASANPQSGAAQRDVAVTYTLIGDVISHPAASEAAANYRSALAIIETLVASDPANTQYGRDRLVTFGRLADALSRSGRFAEARKVSDRAARLLEGVQPRDAIRLRSDDLLLHSAYEARHRPWQSAAGAPLRERIDSQKQREGPVRVTTAG